MNEVSSSAADDLLNIYWRHHAKWNMPPGLRDKQTRGEDLTQLANACCLVADGLLERSPLDSATGPLSLKETLEVQQAGRRYRQLWEERRRLLPLLEKVMAELDGDEWYYFWGLHQILDILPQTLEEK